MQKVTCLQKVRHDPPTLRIPIEMFTHTSARDFVAWHCFLDPVSTLRVRKMATPAPLIERPFSKNQLFCSNLPWSVNGQMLRTAFEKHGEVTDAFVAHNGRSSRGFGYVTFKDPVAAAAALNAANGDGGIQLGEENGGREIRVEMARERPGPRPEPRDRAQTPREPDGAPRERRDGDKTPRAAGDKPS